MNTSFDSGKYPYGPRPAIRKTSAPESARFPRNAEIVSEGSVRRIADESFRNAWQSFFLFVPSQKETSTASSFKNIVETADSRIFLRVPSR